MQQVLDDVEEVKVIMIDNLNKEEERAGKLLDLEDRANDLSVKVGLDCFPNTVAL